MTYTLTLSDRDASIVLAALGKQPLEIVLGAYNEIRSQVDTQNASTPTDNPGK